jgi:hypothetical protein
MAIRKPERRTVSIDAVIPYWRNPRVLSEEAIAAVGESIKSYGYAQPIVVDEGMVIIIGHTRYAALRKLGFEQVEVQVVDYLGAQEIKQLRVVDNRAGEYAFWDFDKLQEEIGQSESRLLTELFPEILGHLDESGSMNSAAANFMSGEGIEVDTTVEFVCPKCFHEWETDVSRDQIMKGRIDA